MVLASIVLWLTARVWRHALERAGIVGVTPHMFRRNEHVNPLTAELLDRAFARGD